MIYVCVPLAIWFLAFLTWLYWQNAIPTTRNGSQPSPPAANRNYDQPSRARRPQEKILEQDRKKLEDILKRRNG